MDSLLYEGETVLPDDYPIYGDYLYVADGRLYRSDYHGVTARYVKVKEGFTEMRRCNIEARRAALQETGR